MSTITRKVEHKYCVDVTMSDEEFEAVTIVLDNVMRLCCKEIPMEYINKINSLSSQMSANLRLHPRKKNKTETFS